MYMLLYRLTDAITCLLTCIVDKTVRIKSYSHREADHFWHILTSFKSATSRLLFSCCGETQRRHINASNYGQVMLVTSQNILTYYVFFFSLTLPHILITQAYSYLAFIQRLHTINTKQQILKSKLKVRAFTLRWPLVQKKQWSDFLNVWSVVTCEWPLASGRPSIPPFIWQSLSLSPPPPPPLLLLTPHTLASINQPWRGFIQSLPNGIIWYVAPVEAGWEATVYAVFRPITLTSQPTHKESFERPVFGGIRWAFCPITAEWIQSPQTDMFTKLFVGGATEIRCATLNNRGLITGWRK